MELIKADFGLKEMGREEVYSFCEARMKELDEMNCRIQRIQKFFLWPFVVLVLIAIGEWFSPSEISNESFAKILIIGVLANITLFLLFFLLRCHINIPTQMMEHLRKH